MKRAIIILLFSLLITSYQNVYAGQPIRHTEQETLEFMVKNSDIIAVAFITGGTDKLRITFWKDFPEKANVKILDVVKGDKSMKNIEIINEPKFTRPGSVKSTVVLRNGHYLVFLAKTGDKYQPTTGFSLLDIFKNNVHPIWKQKGIGNGISPGHKLQSVIKEITQNQ